MKIKSAGLAILAGMVLATGVALMKAAPEGSGETVAVSDPGWLTSFEKAKALAQERQVPIMADFSGSDWCGWCIKLEKEVFSEKAFGDYAATNLVLLLVDFPRRKAQEAALAQHNEQLAERYGIQGFPTVLLMDATGKELARTGYRRGGAAAYVGHLKELLGKR